MRSRTRWMLLATAFCAGVVACGLQTVANARAQSRLFVRVVVEETCEKPTRRVLADLQFEAVPGKPLNVISGGETRRYGLPFGTHVTGQVDRTDDARDRVMLEIDLAEMVDVPSPETEVVRHDRVSLCTRVERGRTCRLNCGGDRWCALTVSEDPEPQPSRSH